MRFTTGSMGWSWQALASSPLFILDVMLPRIGGMELFKELRTRSSVPVLMLTARGDEIDRIVALEGGGRRLSAEAIQPRESES
jgi:two-component system OmpR family response regulator